LQAARVPATPACGEASPAHDLGFAAPAPRAQRGPRATAETKALTLGRRPGGCAEPPAQAEDGRRATTRPVPRPQPHLGTLQFTLGFCRHGPGFAFGSGCEEKTRGCEAELAAHAQAGSKARPTCSAKAEVVQGIEGRENKCALIFFSLQHPDCRRRQALGSQLPERKIPTP
jgi:hypothetical protein